MAHEQEHVAGEARYNHAIQIGLFLFFVVIWVLDSFIFRFTTYFWSIPFYVALAIGFFDLTYTLSFLIPIVLGIVIIILGLRLMQRSHVVFEGKESKVVDHGVYGRVRHPMYLGSILLYVGFWITTISLLTLIPLLTIIVGYNYLANVEERILIEKFGDQYRDYMKRVPKWFPRQ
ncbi:MAG: methyltransferase family protein [Candidatus Hodarchaeota archaeon]